MDPALVGVGLGALVLGFVLGTLASRRGRRLSVDWRLRIRSDEEHPPDGG